MPNKRPPNKPELSVKEIGDLYIRNNFQRLLEYFNSQNQLVDFVFLEVIFTAEETKRKVRHDLGAVPHDLLRLEVSGTGTATFHRAEFDKTFLVISATGPVRLRFFVGNYYRAPQNVGVKSTDQEQWYAMKPETTAAAATSGSLPVGGDIGDFLEKASAEDFDLIFKSASFEGYSARFSENFSTVGLRETILQILNFSYVAPLISLSSSTSSALREKGTAVANVGLIAATTRKSNAITAVTFYKSGVLVNTVASPNPAGGNETYTDVAGFSDTQSYYAKVSDGTTVVQSSTLTFTEVYPYYYGVAAPGRTPAQVAALTKYVIANTATVARQFSPTGQVYYFAYPAAYPALTSILDTNGFETIGDWTVSTGNITGLDGNAVSYRIYEFNNLTTQVNFTNTFKQ